MSSVFKRIDLRNKLNKTFYLYNSKEFKRNHVIRISNKNLMIKFTSINRNEIHIKYILLYLCEYYSHKQSIEKFSERYKFKNLSSSLQL